MANRTYFRPRRQEVNQGRLLIDLYDGALEYLQQARNQMVAKKYANRNLLMNRALQILEELSHSLNTEKGGDLAEKLNNLYILCSARLLQANQRMNVEDLDSVVTILTRLRAAYARFPELSRRSCNVEVRNVLAETGV